MSWMRRTTLTALALIAAGVCSASAHDLFLRPRSPTIQPGTRAVIRVLSGTFSRSENAITRDRLADLSLVGTAGREPIDRSGWSEAEPESTLALTLGEAGTYVVGAAIRPRALSLPAAEFNAYLKEEGIETMLARRRERGELGRPSRERYAKYVKTLIQVGAEASDKHATVLGYAAEIVPVQNPFALAPGKALTVRCLVDGKPLVNYPVFAGGRTPSQARLPQQRLRTDADGLATIGLSAAGDWYVKFVHMAEVDDPEVIYESKWATLTFAVRAPPVPSTR